MLLVSPERLNNPRFRDEQLPAAGRALRAARRRRGALHQRLGPRLPARLPPHPRPADRRCRPTPPGARHDRDRQRPGGRRRRRAARRRRRARCCTLRGGAGPRLACASGVLPLPTRRAAARLAGRPPRRAAGQRHRLRADRRRPPRTPRPCCARPATRCAPTPGAPTRPTARELEGALRDNQVKALVATRALGMGFDKPDLGFVVHLGAPSSPVAYYQQVGRAGRATERADVLLLPGARGPRDLALLRHGVDAAPGADADAVLAALAESTRAAVDGGAGDGRRRPPHPARAAAQGARRRRRGAAGHRRLGLDRPAVDLRRRALRPGRRGPRRASSSVDARLPAGTEGCRMALPAGGPRRPAAPPTAAAATGAPARGSTPTVPDGRGPGGRPGPLRRVGVAGRAARPVADRHGPARRAGQRPDRRRRGGASRAGRWPG